MSRSASLLLAALLLAACDDMSHQRKGKTWEESDLFPDGKVAQAPPSGTLALGDVEAQAALSQRPPMTAMLLARGQERFAIFCSPCHGLAGYGDGTIPRRGFPAPPSFHQDRLRDLSAQHIVDVITKGYGVMYGYAARVPPPDRWAIAAYVRALQLSQRAIAADLPPHLREQLADTGR